MITHLYYLVSRKITFVLTFLKSISKCNTLEITIAIHLQENNTHTHKNTIQYKTMDI